MKQQLLLKPSKEKSQFSAVADNVVSSSCWQLAHDAACALLRCITLSAIAYRLKCALYC